MYTEHSEHVLSTLGNRYCESVNGFKVFQVTKENGASNRLQNNKLFFEIDGSEVMLTYLNIIFNRQKKLCLFWIHKISFEIEYISVSVPRRILNFQCNSLVT